MKDFGRLQLELLNKLERGEITREKAQYEVENFWVGGLRNAVIDGDIDSGSLMAGQSVGLIKNIKSVKDIIKEFIDDAEEEFQRIKCILS